MLCIRLCQGMPAGQAGQTHLKSLYSPIDRGTNKKRRSYLYSAGAKRRRMAGAGRILKNRIFACWQGKWHFLRGNRPEGGPKGRARWRAGRALRASRAERTQVHEQQKAPDDAASTQKAGFDGSSRQIKGLQNLELDASALAGQGSPRRTSRAAFASPPLLWEKTD